MRINCLLRCYLLSIHVRSHHVNRSPGKHGTTTHPVLKSCDILVSLIFTKVVFAFIAACTMWQTVLRRIWTSMFCFSFLKMDYYHCSYLVTCAHYLSMLYWSCTLSYITSVQKVCMNLRPWILTVLAKAPVSIRPFTINQRHVMLFLSDIFHFDTSVSSLIRYIGGNHTSN